MEESGRKFPLLAGTVGDFARPEFGRSRVRNISSVADRCPGDWVDYSIYWLLLKKWGSEEQVCKCGVWVDLGDQRRGWRGFLLEEDTSCSAGVRRMSWTRVKNRQDPRLFLLDLWWRPIAYVILSSCALLSDALREKKCSKNRVFRLQGRRVSISCWEKNGRCSQPTYIGKIELQD